MTEQMLKNVLERCGCEPDARGRAELAEGRTLTLYASHDGVALQVTKVVELKLDAGLCEARDAKGETFLVPVEDLFAASVSGNPRSPGRKAGFLG
jgi:hypothetical protein